MNDLLSKVANASLLALAALPLLALSVAHAQTARVDISDINDLSNPAQVAILNERIDRAADQFCRDRGGLDLARLDACKAAVRDEALQRFQTMRAPPEARSSKPDADAAG
jgi:UrcA family protein